MSMQYIGNQNRARRWQSLISGNIPSPTVVITSTESTPTSTSPIPITITFSEEVTGFVVGDIVVGNGVAGGFATVDNIVYTANITPTAGGTPVTVNIPADVCTNLLGAPNIAAEQFSIEYFNNIYYVRKTGNDTTGDGSDLAPWLTINKGLTSIAAGDLLLIGDGTYVEDSGSGYLFITQAFASVATIRSENGNADNVIINGASSGTYDTLIISAGNSNLKFEDITFGMRISTVTNGAVRIARANGIIFNRVKFDAKGNMAVNVVDTSSLTITNITFNACTFETISGSSQGAVVDQGAGVISNIAFNNCIGLATSYSLNLVAGTNITVSGGTFTNPGALPAIIFGKDADSSTETIIGSINNAVISSNSSHALIIGAGASGIVAENCTITGGDYGIVLKQDLNTVISYCDITGGTIGGIYLKASVGSDCQNNEITVIQGHGFIVSWNPSSTDLSGNWTFMNNIINVSATGKALNIGGDTDDSGGGVCDYNSYENNLGIGVVRSDGDVQSLAELQAAWSDYDVPTNDTNSIIF